MDNSWVLPVILAIIGSSGFWMVIQLIINSHLEKKKNKSEDLKDIEDRLGKLSDICMGLAYDRIMHVGSTYLSKGYITIDEREDFRKYLWGPYHNAGGNGSGDAMMRQIDQLPVRKGKVET